jgi:hypothetical protein
MDVDVDMYVGALRRDVRWLIEEETGVPHTQSEQDHARDKDVVIAVMITTQRKGTAAWPFIVSAIEAASDDDEALGYIGAGDLESLIMWHGDELIDEIETRAPENGALRVALANVWGCGAAEERIANLLAVHGPPSRYSLWTWRDLVDQIDGYDAGATGIEVLAGSARSALDTGDYWSGATRGVFEGFIAAAELERDAQSNPSAPLGPGTDEPFASSLLEFRTFLTDAIEKQRQGQAEIAQRMQRLKDQRRKE